MTSQLYKNVVPCDRCERGTLPLQLYGNPLSSGKYVSVDVYDKSICNKNRWH